MKRADTTPTIPMSGLIPIMTKLQKKRTVRTRASLSSLSIMSIIYYLNVSVIALTICRGIALLRVFQTSAFR